jgi:ubiquinone/menaquinone biosynthesis C-methylase UbiE
MNRIIRRIRRYISGTPEAGSSSAYEVIDAAEAARASLDGWFDRSVAERQDAAFTKLIAAMEEGRPRRDLTVFAEAIRATGVERGTLLEIGCGSGYYSRVLARLVGPGIAYTGLDYSEAMIELARERYPDVAFVVGDATALPFGDASFDIAVNGVALMHIPDYAAAVAEARRVARSWCIFHTVPVLARRATTFLRKNAYGSPTIEIILNEDELLGIFAARGLAVRRVIESLPYDLSAVLGESTTTKTYLCEAIA